MPVDCVTETSGWTGECPACEEIGAKPTYQYKETKIKVMHAGAGIKCPVLLHERKKCDIPKCKLVVQNLITETKCTLGLKKPNYYTIKEKADNREGKEPKMFELDMNKEEIVT